MKSKINDGGPAFPNHADEIKDGFGHVLERRGQNTPGMTLRAWLAGMAMQSFRSGNENEDSNKVAHWAVQDADALIAELEKGTK